MNVLFNPDKEDLVMETPFTIARGVLTEKNGQPTIDYAYMGCSEFEKGAIHRSARRLLNSKWVLRERGIRVFKRNVPLMVAAKTDCDIIDYTRYFRKLATGNHRLQAPAYFDQGIREYFGYEVRIHRSQIPDVWHDISNDVFFTIELERAIKLESFFERLMELWTNPATATA